MLRLLLPILLSLTAIAPNSINAQEAQTPVQISLPHLTAMPGDTLVVAVSIGDVTGLNVLSSNLEITYDTRVVSVQNVTTGGTLASSWLRAHRVVQTESDTMGLVSIGLSTANRTLSGSGALVNLELVVSVSANNQQKSPLTFSKAILNNRIPETSVEHGSITVEKALIGNFNGDAATDFQDFILFSRNFGLSQGDPNFNPVFDLDGDSQIGFSDFVIFVANFGTG